METQKTKKGTLTKRTSGWSVMHGSHIGREVWPIYTPIAKSYSIELLEGWEGLEVDFEIITENVNGLFQYAAKPHLPFVVLEDFETKPGFVEKRTEQMLHIIANEEFNNVGDDGLFPNYSDKDIWIAGFKAGFTYSNKNRII